MRKHSGSQYAKGEMTVREAGLKGGGTGGEIRKQQLGAVGHAALGREGGGRVRERVAKGRQAEGRK